MLYYRPVQRVDGGALAGKMLRDVTWSEFLN
jgi:hypothetical protein